MHAAVNGESGLFGFYNEARAGNLSGRAEKFNFHDKSYLIYFALADIKNKQAFIRLQKRDLCTSFLFIM
jgi:hypothetical protein